jgi:succinoglycan biosynthesis protein ExoA
MTLSSPAHPAIIIRRSAATIDLDPYPPAIEGFPMLVSVIVPVRNEAACIERTLDALRAQDFDPAQFEVIVVDGASDDATPSLVRQAQAAFPNLQLLFNPKWLSSAARNIGIRHARGRFIVIVDGHCELNDRRYLANLVRAFEESSADCLGRPQPLRSRAATPFQKAVSLARASWLGHNPDSDIFSDQARFVAPDNVAVAYRREVFDKVGLFDESFDACEDVEFNTRVRLAGLTCYFTPAIRLDYRPRSSLGGLFYQLARYGRGRARLARKLPSSLTLPSHVPVLWLLWLPAMLALSFVSVVFAAALLASIALYLAAILGESVRLAWRQRLAVAVRLPLVFVGVHLGYGWGFLRDQVEHIPLPRIVSWRAGLRRRAVGSTTRSL